MNCKKCGFQLSENDQFCKNCGTPVDNVSVQNNNEVLNGQVNQNYAQPNIQQPTNNYNQPIMQQPSLSNGYNAQPINQASNNNNIKFVIIGIIVAVVIVGIIIVINIFGVNKSNNSRANGSSSTANNNSATVNNNSNYTVKFENFTFKIPTNLVYETQADSILLGDEEGTWATYIQIIEGNYNKMLSNKNQIQSIYQSQGYTSSAAVEKTIGGIPFITLEVSKSGTNALLGLTKANSMNLFGITAYNLDNEYDYKLLEKVSGILSSAEYSDGTNNMSTFEKPNMSDITGLAK